MPKLDALLGSRIEAIYGRFYSSATCDQADYVYALDSGRFFRFPEIYQCVTHFEYCKLTKGHARLKAEESQREYYQENLFDASNADVLVAEDPELRSPDEFIVALSSRLYLFQESGVPPGCTTRCDLTDRPGDLPLVSVFTTPEWHALEN